LGLLVVTLPITNFTHKRKTLWPGTILLTAQEAADVLRTQTIQVWPPSLEPDVTVNLLKEEPKLMTQTYGDLRITDYEKTLYEDAELPEHLKLLYNESIQQVGNVEDKQKIKKLLAKYNDVFIGPGQPLSTTDKAEHSINTGDQTPIRQKARRGDRKESSTEERERDHCREPQSLELSSGVSKEEKWRSPLFR
jgi:hypothetical protein